MNFCELPKNANYVSKIIAHIWKGRDRKKGGDNLEREGIRPLGKLYFLKWNKFFSIFKFSTYFDYFLNSTFLEILIR